MNPVSDGNRPRESLSLGGRFIRTILGTVSGSLLATLVGVSILFARNPSFLDEIALLVVGLLMFVGMSSLLWTIWLLLLPGKTRKDESALSRATTSGFLSSVSLFLVLAGVGWVFLPRQPNASFITGRILWASAIVLLGYLLYKVAFALLKDRMLILVGLIVVLWAGTVFVRMPSTRDPDPGMKLLLVGIDGAAWNVIDPMIADGELPALAGLMERGCWGILHSFEPTLSPSVWTTIATGKTPDQHGIDGFYVSSKSVRSERVWEILQDHKGTRTGLFRYLVTWPPEPGPEFVIPGWLAGGTETIPPSLEFVKRLERGDLPMDEPALLGHGRNLLSGLNWGFRISTVRQLLSHFLRDRWKGLDRRQRFFERRLLEARIAGDVFSFLYRLQKPALSVLYLSAPDKCSHLYWREYEPEKFRGVSKDSKERFGRVIPDSYVEADKAIEKALAEIDDETYVMVVSDHGFQARETTGRGSIAEIQTSNLLRRLHASDTVEGTNVLARVYLRALEYGQNDLGRVRDVLSSAVLIGNEGLKVFLVDELSDEKLSVTLNPEVVILSETKDLEFILGNETLPLADIMKLSDEYTGTHTLEGIFVFCGPGASTGNVIENATVTDVTPTILWMFGMPTALDMKGRVLLDALPNNLHRDPGPSPESYDSPERLLEVENTEPGGETQESVEEMLRALGYVQ